MLYFAGPELPVRSGFLLYILMKENFYGKSYIFYRWIKSLFIIQLKMKGILINTSGLTY